MPEQGEFEQYELTMPVDDFTRFQIAGVTMHWSVLELTVERVIDALQGGIGVVEYTYNVEQRVRFMKKLTKGSRLEQKQQKHLLAVASAILAMREDRDRVVHGLWTIGPEGKLGSFHPWAKNNQPSKPLDGEKIRDIKRRIFILHRELEKFIDTSLPVKFLGRKLPDRKRRKGFGFVQRLRSWLCNT